MGSIKDALLRMVNTAMKAKKIGNFYEASGYDENPFSEIYGEIASAIYDLVGEEAEKWEKSSTYSVLTAPFIDNERRAASLAYVFEINHAQPAPETMSPEQMKELHQKNGGYMPKETDNDPG